MPGPRIFVSSTCYEFQEVRNNLRSFILEYDFDPVMSDFGDIFYDFDQNVQDSCIKEIENCQMFLLIIGNNYGSLYHKKGPIKEIPNSITLKEFEKAILIDIPKFIFINKFLDHDFNNYKDVLESELKSFFKNTGINSEQGISKKVLEIKRNLDKTYHFPKSDYKYIFYFIEKIYDLTVNNARFTFETFDEIRTQLKKQWAGYFYKKLMEDKLQQKISSDNKKLDEISLKISTIENFLKKSALENSNGEKKLSFDLDKLEQLSKINNFEKAVNILDESLDKILFMNPEGYNYSNKRPRGEISKEITKEDIAKWLKNLNDIVNSYKWSKTIPFTELFKNFSTSYWLDRNDTIDQNNVYNIYNIYKKIPKEDKDSFIITIKKKLEQIYKEPPPEDETDFADEDIPF